MQPRRFQMKHAVLISLIFGAVTAIANAQTSPPTASSPGAAPASRPAASTMPSPADQLTGNWAECRDQAKSVAKDQRKDFMKRCTASVAADCGKLVKMKGLKGDEAKAFRRNCLGAPPLKKT